MPETQYTMQQLVESGQQALAEARGFQAQIDTAPAGTLTDARRTELRASYTTALTRARDFKSRADQMHGESELDTFFNAAITQPVITHPYGPTGVRQNARDGSPLVLDPSGNPVPNPGMPHLFNDGVVNNRAQMLDFIRSTEMRSAEMELLERLPATKPEARAAYNNYLQRPRHAAVERAELNALTPYVDTDGGYVITRELRAELLRQERDLVQIRRYARVLRTNAASVAIPTWKVNISLDQQRALNKANIANIRDVLGMEMLVPNEYNKIIQIPEQLVEDTTFPLMSLLAEEIALQSSEDEESEFLIGDGKGHAYGVLTAPILQADITGSGADITPEDIKAAPYKLRQMFRRRGAWMTNREEIAKVAVMRTDSGAGPGTGQFLWQMGLQPGEPDRLAGYPVMESAFFPQAAVDGDPLWLFADWLQYWIVDRLNLTLKRLDELYAAEMQIGFRYRKRFTGAPIRLEAFLRLNRN